MTSAWKAIIGTGLLLARQGACALSASAIKFTIAAAGPSSDAASRERLCGPRTDCTPCESGLLGHSASGSVSDIGFPPTYAIFYFFL
jgi:hypothetical protein